MDDGPGYSRFHLNLVEDVIRAIVSDDFALGPTGRKWLDDDEYLVRKRIHADSAPPPSRNGEVISEQPGDGLLGGEPGHINPCRALRSENPQNQLTQPPLRQSRVRAEKCQQFWNRAIVPPRLARIVLRGKTTVGLEAQFVPPDSPQDLAGHRGVPHMARCSAEPDTLPRTTPGLRRSDRFLAGLQHTERVVLVSHVNPDPDALASMLRHRHLVETRLTKPTLLTRDGHVGRAENQAMIGSCASKELSRSE